MLDLCRVFCSFPSIGLVSQMADLVILDLNWVRSISYCRATDIIIVYYIVYSGALFPSGRFIWSAQINCLFFADTSQQIQTFQLEPRFGRPYPILIDSYLREVYQAAGDFGLWNLRIWPIWYLMGVAGMVLSFYNSFIRIACTASLLAPSPYNWLSITIEMTFSSRPGQWLTKF